jgi:hypothetical protein
MVAAVSEAAINSQFRQYLTGANQKSSHIYYIKYNLEYFKVTEYSNDGELPKKFPQRLLDAVADLKKNNSSLFQEFERANIFDMNYTKSTESEGCYEAPDAVIEMRKKYFFSFALELQEGIDPNTLQKVIAAKNPDVVCKPVELHSDEGNKNHVKYTQFFSKFTAIEIFRGDDEEEPVFYCSVFKQSEQQNPVVFEYDIQMNFFDCKYDNMPEDSKQWIQNLTKIPNPDDLFEISKLALNFEKMSNVSTYKLDVSKEVNTVVASAVEELLQSLKGKDITIFGYTLKPRPDTRFNYLFTPKYYTFTVSENNIGKKAGYSSIKTLNYVIMFDETAFPKLDDFQWNWLEAENTLNYAGIMAINRDKFVWRFLEEFRGGILKNLRFNVNADVEGGVYVLKYSIGLTSNTSHDPQLFKPSSDSAWDYVYSYTSSQESERRLLWAPPLPFPIASAKMKHSYTLKCKVKRGTVTNNNVTIPALVFETRISAWADFDHDTESNSGTYFDQTVICTLGIAVDAYGRIDFIKDARIKDNNPGGINIGTWSKIDTLGAIDAVKDVAKKLGGCIQNIENNVKNEFLTGFVSYAQWVMPGCKTFTFKDEQFSTGMDFCTYINYADPNTGG